MASRPWRFHARLSHIERLRVPGKIDETEDNSGDEGGANVKKGNVSGEAEKRDKERYRPHCSMFSPFFDIHFADIFALGRHSCRAGEAERREEEGSSSKRKR
jgi:hypothetical protein